MTKKLEETFDMDGMNEISELIDSAKDIKISAKVEMNELVTAEHIETHEKELDKYANHSFDLAKEAADLAMNSEPRHSAELFNSAASLIKTALDAQNSKIEKRTKLLELEMRMRKMEHDMRHGRTDDIDDSGQYVSREDILGKKDK